jgi:hypothetical protein
VNVRRTPTNGNRWWDTPGTAERIWDPGITFRGDPTNVS